MVTVSESELDVAGQVHCVCKLKAVGMYRQIGHKALCFEAYSLLLKEAWGCLWSSACFLVSHTLNVISSCFAVKLFP